MLLRRVIVLPFAALLLAGGCSSESESNRVAVNGTNDACTPKTTDIAAGKVTFEFTNNADKVSELYVLTEQGDVLAEVENVTNGTKRNITADLTAGDYLLRCKPGQSGDGITTQIKVTGEGGTAREEPGRTVQLQSKDFEIAGVPTDVKAGETIRFEMTNAGPEPHEFEVLDPSGEAIGEVASVEPGKSGGANVTFGKAGTYTWQCILKTPEGQSHDMLGMKGEIKVA